MNTLTEKQFKEKYGVAGVEAFGQKSEEKKGLAQRIGSFFKGTATDALNSLKTTYGGGEQGIANRLKQDIQAGSQDIQDGNIAKGVLKSGFRTAGDFAGTVYAPVGAALEATGVNKIFQKIGELSANNPLTDIPALQEWAMKHPNASDDFTRALNIATAGLDKGKINPSTAVSRTISQVKAPFNALNSTLRTGVNDIKSNIKTKQAPADVRLQKAIEDATPNYENMSTAQKQKVLGQVKEGGILKGRSIEPSKLQQEAGLELSNVPQYNPNATKLEKYQLVKSEVAKKGEELKISLQNENILVPKKEVTVRVKTALNEVPKDSLLLQKSDPAIKNYLRVYNNAIKNVSGTLDGILELRKSLDNVYENARGKQAFGSDKVAALDDVHTAVRNKLTEYLIEKAKSTDVKASLRSQWNLYRALDELQISASKESGSKFGRLKQKYPITNKTVQTGVKAAGLGAGLNIIQ